MLRRLLAGYAVFAASDSSNVHLAGCAGRTWYVAAGRAVIAVIVAKCLFKYRRVPPRRRCRRRRRSVYLPIFLLSPLQLHAATSPSVRRHACTPVAVAGTPSRVLLSYSLRCYYCRLFFQIVSNYSSVLQRFLPFIAVLSTASPFNNSRSFFYQIVNSTHTYIEIEVILIAK